MTIVDLWRERLRTARRRYQETAKEFAATWGEHFQMHLIPDSSHAIRQARRVESKALEEYVRVLKIFTNLFVRGEIPPNE